MHKQPSCSGLSIPGSSQGKTQCYPQNPEPLETKVGGCVVVIGQGDYGQLGLGMYVNKQITPAVVEGLENVVDICAGGMHTVCLTKFGEVLTFGYNGEGALGRDTSVLGSESIPGKVDIANTVQISAGDDHTAALTNDGRVFAWGCFRDKLGIMGLCDVRITEPEPMEIFQGLNVLKIASGSDHIVALTKEGRVYTCGSRDQGQLGRVSLYRRNHHLRNFLHPARVVFDGMYDTLIEDIWTGSFCTYAKVKNRIYVFGLNNYKQLDVDGTSHISHPVISKSLSGKNWMQICGGEHHTIALDDEGHVYALGLKDYGCLGLGEGCRDAEILTVIPKLADKKIMQITCGDVVSLAVAEKGEVYRWGRGTNRQLGSNGESRENCHDLYEPRQIQLNHLESNFVFKVSASAQHTVLLTKKAN